MTKKMLIDAAHPEEIRVALLDHNKVEDFDFESAARKPLRGNIYLARVTRVEPSLQAAFVEYGGNRHGFLAFSEIHPDYYQIPVSDRQLLQKAEAEVADLAAQLELVQRGDDDDDDEDHGGEPGQIETVASEDDEEHAVAEAGAADEEEEEQDDDAGDDGAEDVDSSREEEEEEEDVKKEDAKAQSSEEDDNASQDENDDKQAKEQEAADESEQPFVEFEEDDAVEAVEEDEEETVEASDDEDEDSGQVSGEEDDDEGAGAEEKAATSRKSGERNARKERDALFERYKEAKRKRSNLLRNYKIQEVIKRRQILLVQVVKEERGNKGAALTTYMSLAGRYCVLMPNTARGGGISRKIANPGDRRRLRRVVDSLEVPQGMGLIIRTAGAKRTKTEIKRDYDYLLRLWENIRTLTLKSIAPCLIYEEASLIKRAIRDLYDKDISKVLVEGENGYREAKDFMKMLMPSHAKFVQPYKERTPIFLKYGVESQLDGMYQPTVRLKSGGYIVIHQTEALVAIDVNSGRATRERNIEQTALKTNIEAAQEAARQFRLRDLAGLIVLDFIDMEEPKNNRKVERALKEALKTDRARIQMSRISNFGLLELSRQRRRSGIVDGTTHACPTCSGAGVIRSHEMAALRILRAIEGEAVAGKAGHITVHTSLDVSLYVLNHHRDWLKRIETDNGVTVEIIGDQAKVGDAYELEKSGTPKERSDDTPVIRADHADAIEPEETVESHEDEETSADGEQEEREGGRKRRRRRRRRKDVAKQDQAEESISAQDETEDASDSDGEEEEKAAREDEGERPKRRRRRGRRGGRRNRKPSDEAETPDSENAEEQVAGAAENETEEDERSDSSELKADVEAVEESPPEPDAEETASEEHKDDAEPASANGEEGGESEVSAENASPEEQPSPASTQKKSSRRGWWQRATGS